MPLVGSLNVRTQESLDDVACNYVTKVLPYTGGFKTLNLTLNTISINYMELVF